MALAAAGSFISLMYFAVSESQKKQATVGKHAMGLKVSTIDGNPKTPKPQNPSSTNRN